MNTTVNDTTDIDSLLDSTLDDLADMPEFKPFPEGAHRVTIKWDYTKKINEKTVIQLELKSIETVELKDPSDVPTAKDDTTNVIFMLTKKDGTVNEMAQGQLKEILKPLQVHLKTTSNRETMEKSNGLEVLVVTEIRKDKKDKDDIKYYTGIVALQVL